jgi:hypothetical protein
MDLIVGTIFTGFLSLLAGYIGARLPRRTHPFLLLPLLGLLIAYHFLWRDRLVWAALMPTPGVLAWSNLLPIGIAMIVGLLYQRFTGPRWHKLTQCVLIGSVGTFAAYLPLIVPPPVLPAPEEHLGVTLQTSNATCGAASGVNLLRHYGVMTSEMEVATLAHTGPGGTPLLGLYRALHTLAPVGQEVSVLSFATPEQLQDAVAQGPVLVSLGQEWWQTEPIEFQTQKFWPMGAKHAVVVTRFLPYGRVEILDPAIGREIWHAKGLLALWHGEGMYFSKIGP